MKNEEFNDMFKSQARGLISDVKPDDVAEASVALVKLIQAGIKIWRDIMK